MKSTDNNTERHIINVAKQVFLEKGFAETNMSDIAARAGINRPGLHYYFRTKDRMFEAVFADIVKSFIPTIRDIIHHDKPVIECIPDIVDAYFSMVRREPLLPLFMIREIQRDAHHLTDTICSLDTAEYVQHIKETLLRQMHAGTLRSLPIEFVFYTFYGLLTFPFLTQPLADIAFGATRGSRDEMLTRWKVHIVEQMTTLLAPRERRY